ncbi:hypothetical protein F2Z80_11625 [Vibrio fortis]|uniref:Uncharacterized protein n=1 Tax=Vibrio fortis TaxID=212667 RepID=A0A5N3SD75_9VIBR|nr:hypothetical protein F2Z80_11625 [Vibrio fortis]
MCRILRFELVTQFIDIILIPKHLFAFAFKSENKLSDIHQRVPTQIDRFKFLKSLLLKFRLEPLELDGYSSELAFSVKHFLSLIFQSILNA